MVRAESGRPLRGWQEDVGEERGTATALHRTPLSSPALSLKEVWCSVGRRRGGADIICLRGL